MYPVIVTGGAGFIGSHIVEKLVDLDMPVFVMDNLSIGKEENLEAVLSKITLLHVDIEDYSAVKRVFDVVYPRYVFHCAAMPQVERSIVAPLETHDTNVNGTLNILLASRDCCTTEKVIFSSSSAVYGNSKSFPVSEYSEVKPLHPYGLQKLIGEQYCKMFSELYGLHTIALRYQNVYGDRMGSEGAYCTVLPIFFKQKKEGKPLTIVPDGEQSRDFTFVDDVVEVNILSMVSESVGKYGDVFNIGSGEEHTINEIAGWFGGERVFISPRVEPRRSLADISKARKVLGWEPKGSLVSWINRSLNNV